MKKSKIKIYGVVIILVFVSIFGYCIFSKNISNVSAENNSATDCLAGECGVETKFKEWDAKDQEQINGNVCDGYNSSDVNVKNSVHSLLNRYYGINYKIDTDNNKFTIHTREGSTGVFKIVNVQKEVTISKGGKQSVTWQDIRGGVIDNWIGKTFNSSGITLDLNNLSNSGNDRYNFVVELAETDSSTGCKPGSYYAEVSTSSYTTQFETSDIPHEQSELCSNFFGGNLDYVYDGVHSIKDKLSKNALSLYNVEHVNNYKTKEVMAYCTPTIQNDKVLYYSDMVIDGDSENGDKSVITNNLDILVSNFDTAILNVDGVLNAYSESVAHSTRDWSVPDYNGQANSAFYFGKRNAINDGNGYVIKGGQWFNIKSNIYADNKINFDDVLASDKPIENNPFELKCESNSQASTYKYSKGDVLDEFATFQWKWTDNEGKSGFYELKRDDTELSYNIKANTKFYYGIEDSYKTVSLTHNFAGGQFTKDDVKVCRLTCEEVVEVNYGPPIATTAGLCFQYQAQVSSTVKCNSEQLITLTGTNYGVCDIAPFCAGRSTGIYLHQGGSNDEFDACINNCDGGKYTDKCSEKCYSSVYGDSNDNQLLSYLDQTPVASKLRLWWPLSWYGKYTLNTDGSIGWNNKYSYSRYYREHEYSRTVREHDYGRGGYLPLWGIKRHNYGNNLCGESCYFAVLSNNGAYPESYMKNFKYMFPLKESDISRNRDYAVQTRNTCYFNPEDAQADFDRNKEIINTALNECKAGATCTTKTANFTFDVSYVDGENGQQTTVHFPYSTSDDKSLVTSLQSSSKKDDCLKNDNVTNVDLNCNTFTTEQDKLLSTEDKEKIRDACLEQEKKVTSNNSVVDDFDGCYFNCNDKPVYNTHWTFPMLWRDTKHNKLTYIVDNVSGYVTYGRKFCLIRTAADVNQKYWYDYNYDSIMGENVVKGEGIGQMPYNTELLDEKCCLTSNKNKYDKEDKEITYNILGKAVDFGHFGWDLNIKCFYALATPVCDGKSTDECTGGLAFKTRAVDLHNMFPPNEKGDYDIGYNWSDAASFITIVPGGEKENLVVPSYYKYQLEFGTDGLYKDDNLDYQFDLSASDIKKLKAMYNGKASKPTNPGGIDYILSHGVYSYSSPLIRGASSPLDSGKKRIPKSLVLGCNNIENYNASNCKTYDFQDKGGSN